MRCLNDTAGAQCERCMDGFYGDAITAKNCLGMWCFFFCDSFKIIYCTSQLPHVRILMNFTKYLFAFTLLCM